ncbi:hypothetical protein KKE06_05665, partial [Candidatus Micrarchaeota archaeon]|nr:hypothetical protein [Candidatus Micrarchaeota archaeon]
FWGWREKRISKQLAKKQRKLSTAQAKQARITQRIGAKFDYKLAKKQKKSDLAQVHLDFSLSKMARHLERYKKIVDLKASRLELLNQGMPAGNQLPANQFAELRNKITEHVQNTGGKTGAFRLLEIEHGIEQIRQLLLRNQFAPAQTRMGELIAFNENAP